MQIKEFLDNICEQIKYKPIRTEISEEIENHLKEAKENLVLEGMEEQKAEQEAIKQMGNAEEIGRKLNKIHKPKMEWKLLLLGIVLLLFGGLVAFTRAINYPNYIKENCVVPYTALMRVYIITLVVGIIFSIGIYFLDYRKIVKIPKTLYAVATFIMFFGSTFGCTVINGARNYIFIFGNLICISTLCVPLYMLAFIGFLQKIDRNKNLKVAFLQKELKINLDILKIIVLSGISLIWFIKIPATVLMCLLAVIYLMIATVKVLESKKNRKMRIAILWGIPILFCTIFMIVIMPMAWDRLVGSFDPEQDPKGRGWVGVNQSMVLKSANLLGQAEDMSNAISLFDEGTNFAFISILAHYGWIVAISMVIAIVMFSVKLLMNATKIKDMSGKLIVVGISGLFILQSIFNLLMNLNLGIKSNVNIPFISYGRQELILNMICLALVLSVYRRKDILTKRRQ